MARRELALLAAIVLLSMTATARAAEESAADRGLYLSSDEGARIAAPIVGTAITMRVTGVVARARVTQIFLNPTQQWVEGTYVFPLPDGAAVDRMRMKIGDRVLEGAI